MTRTLDSTLETPFIDHSDRLLEEQLQCPPPHTVVACCQLAPKVGEVAHHREISLQRISALNHVHADRRTDRYDSARRA